MCTSLIFFIISCDIIRKLTLITLGTRELLTVHTALHLLIYVCNIYFSRRTFQYYPLSCHFEGKDYLHPLWAIIVSPYDSQYPLHPAFRPLDSHRQINDWLIVLHMPRLSMLQLNIKTFTLEMPWIASPKKSQKICFVIIIILRISTYEKLCDG